MEKEIINKCESVMEEMGLLAISDEKKAELMDKMAALIFDRVILKLMGRISDVEIEEANEIMTGEDEEKKIEFIKIKMPDLDSVLDEEMGDVKSEILKNID